MFKIFQLAMLVGLLSCGSSIKKNVSGQKVTWGGEPATVTFHIIDTYGKPVKYRVESFRDIEQPNIELAGQFQGLTFRGAFTGKTYEFRLAPSPETKKFSAFKEQIIVGEPSTFALFALDEESLIPDMMPFPVTHMVLKPAPAADGGPVWATARPAFLPRVYDLGSETVAVDSQGRFNLHGLHGARYVIAICRDGETPKLALVDIPTLSPETPIEVNLK
jgi:hypothetical protein